MRGGRLPWRRDVARAEVIPLSEGHTWVRLLSGAVVCVRHEGRHDECPSPGAYGLLPPPSGRG